MEECLSEILYINYKLTNSDEEMSLRNLKYKLTTYDEGVYLRNLEYKL